MTKKAKSKARSFKRPDSKTGEMQTINTSVFTDHYDKFYKYSSKTKQSIAYHIRQAMLLYIQTNNLTNIKGNGGTL